METKNRKRLLGFLLILVSFPLVQKNLEIFSGLGLSGDFTNASDVSFSWEKWWDGSFQQGKNNYINDQVGFRPDLVRINNQLDYWLFNKVHSNSVVLGTHKCLFQKDYIKAYFGRDFVGYQTILNNAVKLKAIQDTLAHLGKSLILVHSACKAFFYPGYFPEDMVGPHVGPTNYETYKRVCDSLGVNQVDFNAWLVSMRDTSKALLYPLEGVHWSVYGSVLAADSLVKYIEKLRNIRMPGITWDSITHTTKARFTDNDIYRALNLTFPMVKEDFSYPNVRYLDDSTKKKPVAIYIGDSFLLNFLGDNLMTGTNTDWDIWYYFKRVIKEGNRNNVDAWINMDNYDWISKMNNSDCIILMYTSHNLKEIGNGFIDKAYDHFYPAKK